MARPAESGFLSYTCPQDQFGKGCQAGPELTLFAAWVSRVDSSDRRNDDVKSCCQPEDLCGRFPAQNLAGPVFPLGLDNGEVEGIVDPQVGTFPQVLAEQATVFSLVPRIHGERGLAKNTPWPNKRAT